MTSLETQVGQIFISDKKLSRSFVSLLSEKVPETNAEIFSLIEIPILNPSAWPEYEKLAKTIQSVLRRNFRRPNDNAFENSIAQINDELAKIAAAGQTAWVGKMNGCLAVRQNDNLFISTTGKIHAYLFRDKQLSDIADSPQKNNPLKTFENFAVGKVLKKDYLIFTTTQLLNYISVERLKDIINKSELGSACQNIAGIIKDLADDTVSFGTFILELGDFKDLANIPAFKVTNSQETKNNLPDFTKAKLLLKPLYSKVLNFLKNLKKPGINLKDVSPVLLAEKAKKIADIQKIRALPKAKKFFLGSTIVFVLILLINIFVAIHIRSNNKSAQQVSAIFNDIQTKVNDANSAYIYNDKTKASQLLSDAQGELNKIPDNKNFQKQKTSVAAELIDLQNSIGGLKTAQVTSIGKYTGTVDNLKSVSGKLFLSSNSGLFIPILNKTFGQSFTVPNISISNINTTDSALYFANSNGNVFSVDTDNKNVSQQKAKINIGKGLVFYGSPTKAYTVDPKSNQILMAQLNKPDAQTNYLKEAANLSNALDLSIDGAIYVLFPDHITKFSGGTSKPFANPNLQFSNNAKIYANNVWKYIYIMDPGSKKIIILDKNGTIKAQYTSLDFTNLKDMVVDEISKNIYILNDSQVFQFPTI
jgi:hypothetical protein